jgi:hypothetical protein
MFAKNKRVFVIVFSVLLLMLIPFIAMQFFDEVTWTLLDFSATGILLLSTGLVFELVLRKVTNSQHRIAICAFVLIVLFLVWAELAVGIFGSPMSGN